jgi:D-alanyl-D-alanine carboxypeptidase
MTAVRRPIPGRSQSSAVRDVVAALTMAALGGATLAVCVVGSEAPDADHEPTPRLTPSATVLERANPAFDTSAEALVGRASASELQLVAIEEAHTNKPTRLEASTLAAFERMRAAAARDGLQLIVVSGHRSFDHQRAIWERKWNSEALAALSPTERAEAILRTSALPGTSRHHWGTDIDLNSVEPSYFEEPEGRATYAWLSANAANFGFCQVYTEASHAASRGYDAEPWHWSYMPQAQGRLAAFVARVPATSLSGFEGDEVVEALDPIQRFVAGVDPRCANVDDPRAGEPGPAPSPRVQPPAASPKPPNERRNAPALSPPPRPAPPAAPAVPEGEPEDPSVPPADAPPTAPPAPPSPAEPPAASPADKETDQ